MKSLKHFFSLVVIFMTMVQCSTQLAKAKIEGMQKYQSISIDSFISETSDGHYKLKNEENNKLTYYLPANMKKTYYWKDVYAIDVLNDRILSVSFNTGNTKFFFHLKNPDTDGRITQDEISYIEFIDSINSRCHTFYPKVDPKPYILDNMSSPKGHPLPVSFKNIKDDMFIFYDEHSTSGYFWHPEDHGTLYKQPIIQKENNKKFWVQISTIKLEFYLWKENTDFLLTLDEMDKIVMTTPSGQITTFYFDYNKLGDPEVETLYLNSEYGYFSGTKTSQVDDKRRRVFSIGTTKENFDNFSLQHLSVLIGVETYKAIPEIIEESSNKKRILIRALGLNWTIKEYIVDIFYSQDSFEKSVYDEFMSKVSGISRLYSRGVYNGLFTSGGRILKLSKQGNSMNIDTSGSYEYHLVRVYNANKAVYKNKRSGAFLLMNVEKKGTKTLVYFMPPKSESPYKQDEIKKIGSIVGNVTTLASLSILNITRGNLAGALGIAGAAILNAIINGIVPENTTVTLSEFASFGYLLDNFSDKDPIYWGETN